MAAATEHGTDGATVLDNVYSYVIFPRAGYAAVSSGGTTDDELAAALKELLGEEVSDELASLYVKRAKATILRRRRPFLDIDEGVVERMWESKFDPLALQIAEFMYLKRGAEGQIKHTENGIAREWQRGDVPWDMLADVKPIAGTVS